MKRTPIRRCSKKRAKELIQYRLLRKQYMSNLDHCEMPDCIHMATDIHHKAGRGKHLNDMASWMGLCRLCHERVHNNPSWARAQGYITK